MGKSISFNINFTEHFSVKWYYIRRIKAATSVTSAYQRVQNKYINSRKLEKS